MSVKVNVTIVEGPAEGTHIEFSQGSITLGRGRCDISLDDKKVSGKHCKLSLDKQNNLWLEDLNSTNGTYVGGRRIEAPEQLQNLDEFIVGLSRISVAIVESIGEKSISKTKNTRSISRPEPKVPDTIPPPHAVYQETGIHRIENLIEDEMAALSRWDSPPDHAKHSGEKTLSLIRVTLKRLRGPESLNEFICSKPVNTMGRKNVDVKLNDLDCSRLHSQIEIHGKKAVVKDMGSTNGTFLNGRRVTAEEIQTGDVIQIGQTFLEVHIEGRS